jgi:uncharacterized protein
MLSAPQLLECVISMTESERRQFATLLFPVIARLSDFADVVGLSGIQPSQAVTESIRGRHNGVECGMGQRMVFRFSSEGRSMQRRDWNLLVLAAAEGQALSPVQFQKALFLISRNLPGEVGENFYDFQPYNYGPFDADVYNDALSLVPEQLAAVSKSPQGWTEYSATPNGLARAKQIAEALDPKVSSYVERLVKWVRSQSFPALVRAIYHKYPEMKVNSVFGGSET